MVEHRKLMIMLLALALPLAGCLGASDEPETDPGAGDNPDDGGGEAPGGDGNPDGDSNDGSGDADDGDQDDGSGNGDEDPGDDDAGDTGGSDNDPADSGNATAPVENVTIKDFAYDPDTLTVAVGTTVNWTNMEEMAGGAVLTSHTVTEENGTFDSGMLAPGESFTFTFEEPGTYAYKCTAHPTMTATVVVEGDAGEDADDAA